MAVPNTCVITSPVEGAVYYVLPGATTVTVVATGTTDAATQVQVKVGGVNAGAAVTSSGAGAWSRTGVSLAVGARVILAVAGTDPDTLNSTPVNVTVSLPTLPAGLMTGEWYANWLCGAVTGVGTSPPYTMGDALKRWCGLDPASTSVWLNTSVVDALNDRVSIPTTLRKSVRQVLNIIAGTTGLPVANALKIICEGELS